MSNDSALPSSQEAVRVNTQEIIERLTKNNQEIISPIVTLVKAQEKRLLAVETRVGSVEAKVEEVENRFESNFDQVASKISELEKQLSELRGLQHTTQRQHEITQRSVHDPYMAAFSRNEEFEEVFLFFILYGFCTSEGHTCVVFRKVNDVPCVCVNFRALHNIAKLLLSGRLVASIGLFPKMKNFRITCLQELFTKAQLPQRDLNKGMLTELYKKLPVVPLKSFKSNLTSWMALEMKPFVTAVTTLVKSGKVDEMRDLFEKNFPKRANGDLRCMAKLTEKDKVVLLDTSDPEISRPIFGQPYWKELFYDGMKVYREMLDPSQPASQHAHFFCLADVDYEEPILNFEDIRFQPVVEEPSEEVEDSPPVTRSRGRKRVHIEEEEEEEEPRQRKRHRNRPTHGEKAPRYDLGSD